MTKEEAAEILLEDEPIIECPLCIDLVGECSSCRNLGYVIDAAWIQANLLLKTMSDKEAVDTICTTDRWFYVSGAQVDNPRYILALRVIGLDPKKLETVDSFTVYVEAIGKYREKHGIGNLRRCRDDFRR